MAKGFKHGTGGGPGFNFRVLGGTTAPSSPKENDIWVNTDTEIRGWYLGAEEPNVYDIKPLSANDPHVLIAPHRLSEGDILNFEIPETVDGTLEALRIRDASTGKEYCVRSSAGEAVPGWYKGIKLCVFISNDIYPIGSWAGQGTAIWMTWGSYYHKEGTLWIQISNSSPVAFNALKKNSIMVYPISAKQYVGGAWTDVTAKSYKKGQWVSWWVPGTLFENGIDDTALTGGWDSFAYSAGSGYAEKTVAVEVSSEGVCATLAGTGYRSTFIGTKNKVDVTEYSTLKFDFSEATRSTGSGAIVVRLYSDAGYTVTASANVIGTDGSKNLSPEIDVSGLSGSYYIGYFMWMWSDCTISAKMSTAKLV